MHYCISGDEQLNNAKDTRPILGQACQSPQYALAKHYKLSLQVLEQPDVNELLYQWYIAVFTD